MSRVWERSREHSIRKVSRDQDGEEVEVAMKESRRACQRVQASDKGKNQMDWKTVTVI